MFESSIFRLVKLIYVPYLNYGLPWIPSTQAVIDPNHDIQINADLVYNWTPEKKMLKAGLAIDRQNALFVYTIFKVMMTANSCIGKIVIEELALRHFVPWQLAYCLEIAIFHHFFLYGFKREI